MTMFEGSGNDSNITASGLFCLSVIMQYFRKPFNLEKVQHEYFDHKKLTPTLYIRAIKSLDLNARKTTVKAQRLDKQPLPLIAVAKNGEFFIIVAVREQKVLIQQLNKAVETIETQALFEHWDGTAILVTQRIILPGADKKFDLTWFIPLVIKFRKLFRDVLVASFFIQLFALLTPLVFQVVMDKVLVHHAMLTLNVLTIAILSLAIFEVTLSGLRTYVFSHTSSRVDVALGAQLFGHILKLPLVFFHSRPIGLIVARVRELDTIRNFLTSSALTLLIDVFFSIVFIVVMFFYSSTLAWIVVASIPLYIAISLIITPELRRRTEKQFQHGARNQAFLTESLSGMETLKSMAVEPQIKQRWEDQLAAYARASFRTTVLGMYGSESVQLVSKLVTGLLLWQGAQEVINGNLTVGELIAFNMFSGQVAGPILRLAQLWQDFQQFRISMERLGDVINYPSEPQPLAHSPLPKQCRGEIKLDRVVFRYDPGGQEVLKNVSLTIPGGQILGIAGRSGSGKSTITKLIQRLYIPESGKITIDDQNLAMIDPVWLRKRVGVVLQDNVLFNCSIQQNIALSNPSSPMSKVIEAATLAGAHEFISQLPRGYDTELGERGVGLSGGQLQRIAIARILMSDPSVLILDEATSALDYESESVIQQNMSRICKNRTVIIIAHRLSTLRCCDRILVLDKGTVTEEGTHDTLLKHNGDYARLWAAQSDSRGTSS